MNVLVVDHSKLFRGGWERNALRLGIEPIGAASAEEALEVLRERRIDYVCCSLSLPGMDGVDFCKVMRRNPQLKNTPVVLMSATEDQALRQTRVRGRHHRDPRQEGRRGAAPARQALRREHHRDVTGRVLYVEDSSVVAHVMVRILTEMHLEVDHFVSADVALEAFDRNSYDLVISDIVVEGQTSGVGLVSRIRELTNDKARVPILTMSSLDDQARRIQLFRLGANDFLTKPVVKEEVVARVTNLITAKQLLDRSMSSSSTCTTWRCSIRSPVSTTATRCASSPTSTSPTRPARTTRWR